MVSVICPVREAAARFGTAAAYHDHNREISFAEFHLLVDGVVRRLARLGIQKGDRIAIISRNSLGYAAVLFALARCGAVAVPINTRMIPDDWRSLTGRAGAKRILAGRESLSTSSQLSLPVFPLEEASEETSTSATVPAKPMTLDRLELEQETTILFTSGSSGAAKGVILTYGNHYFNALGSNENLPLSGGDCWLLSLPLYHVGGLSILYRSLLAASAVRIVERFDPQQTNKLIDSSQISHLSLVPTMLTQLLEARDYRPLPKSLKAILLGGAPTPPQVIEEIKRLSLPVLMTYGMTETASQITTTRIGDPPDKLLTSGRLLKYRELRVVDENGRITRAGVEGEIAVRGEVLFKSYLEAPPDTILDKDGWFRTGDFGHLDRDGYLVVVGRKDDMIISGGEKIYPQEIEAAAESYPGCQRSKVIAVTDRLWGQRPVLFIETVQPGPFDMNAFNRFLGEKLPSFKLPRQVFLVSELPLTAIGKVDKSRLMQIYIKATQENDDQGAD